MRLCLVAVDDTSDWPADLAAACGRILTVYMYNPAERVRCCEATPSYLMRPLYAIPANDVTEEQHDLLDEGIAAQDPAYFHCHAVDRVPRRRGRQRLRYSAAGFEGEAEAMEFFRGNPPL